MDLRRQFFVLGSKLQGFKLETFIIVIFSASDPDPLQETWIRIAKESWFTDIKINQIRYEYYIFYRKN